MNLNQSIIECEWGDLFIGQNKLVEIGGVMWDVTSTNSDQMKLMSEMSFNESDELFDNIGSENFYKLVKDLDDATPIYIGVVVFGIMMTLVIVLLLRLDWAKILGRIAPWTLEDDKDN